MGHKVRAHKWYNGILTFADRVFEHLEDALAFANEEAEGEHIKVYNDQDQLIHQIKKTESGNTYA